MQKALKFFINITQMKRDILREDNGLNVLKLLAIIRDRLDKYVRKAQEKCNHDLEFKGEQSVQGLTFDWYVCRKCFKEEGIFKDPME